MKYRGATGIPAKMWKQLVRIAHLHPDPKQFYEKAVELGKEYDIGEDELIAWGTIDPYAKPKKLPPNYTEPQEKEKP